MDEPNTDSRLETFPKEHRKTLLGRNDAILKVRQAEAELARATADLTALNVKLFAAGLINEDVVDCW